MNKGILIFDLDGTIADTIYSIRDGVNLVMDKYGFERRDYEQIRLAIGNGARELIRLSLPEQARNDVALVDEVLDAYDGFYAKTYANLDGCYDGMYDAIHTLRDRGYTIAVLSNKQDEYVKKIIDLLFDDGCISFAAGQRSDLPRKPDPTVPLMIAKRFASEPCNCAFIGDSEVDILTGKNAGMKTVACSWGYRPQEALVGADVVISAPIELIDIFK